MFYILATTGKKIHAKTKYFFKKFEDSLINVSDRSEKILALVVKGKIPRGL